MGCSWRGSRQVEGALRPCRGVWTSGREPQTPSQLGVSDKSVWGQGGRWASGNKVKEKQGRRIRKEKGRDQGMKRKMRGDSRRHGSGERRKCGEKVGKEKREQQGLADRGAPATTGPCANGPQRTSALPAGHTLLHWPGLRLLSFQISKFVLEMMWRFVHVKVPDWRI